MTAPLGKGGSNMNHIVKMTEEMPTKQEIAKVINHWTDESNDLVKEEDLQEIKRVGAKITSKVYALVVKNQICFVVAHENGMDLYQL